MVGLQFPHAECGSAQWLSLGFLKYKLECIDDRILFSYFKIRIRGWHFSCQISKVTSPDVTSLLTTHLPPYSVSKWDGPAAASSLIPRPTVFRDPDFVINYWQNNENKTLPAPVKCSCAPGCQDFFFALIVPAAGRLSRTNFYWQSRLTVSVSDVLKYLAADKCNEWMNEWMKKWKLRRNSFKPMFLLSLLTNKAWYNQSCCPRGLAWPRGSSRTPHEALALAPQVLEGGLPWPWPWEKSLGLRLGKAKAKTFSLRSRPRGCCTCMLCSHSRCHITVCHFLLRNVSQTCMYIRCKL